MQSDEKSFQFHSLCLFFPKNKGNYKNIGCFRRYVVKISSNYIYNTSMYFRFKLNLSYTTCFKNQSFILRSLLQNWPAFHWFLIEIILPTSWVHYLFCEESIQLLVPAQNTLVVLTNLVNTNQKSEQSFFIWKISCNVRVYFSVFIY